MTYREETPADHDAIYRLNARAFGGDDESKLVDALRAGGFVITSRVAVDDAGEVVGHILFSTLPIEGDRTIKAAALAPMAVDPDHQRQGIGSGLVKDGLEACRKHGVEAVIVVGHPEYYPRFGFSAELAESLSAPFSGPAFMALELAPGALRFSGTVKYPPPFGC